jgi:site-specific recombinase XerD
MRVSATLKGHIDSNGCRTVYIRTSEGSKRTFTATKIRVAPKDWDMKRKRVKPSHPSANHFNNAIHLRISNILNGEQPKPSLSFKQYAFQCLNEWDKTKKDGTLRQLKSKIDKFVSFSSVNLSEVTAKLLTKYVSHCYALGNKPNTVWTSLKAVRTIINKAHREKLITDNPFHSFEMPRYKDPAKAFLSKDQVDVIEQYSRNTGVFRTAGIWFVISCYTGLRYSDQRKFHAKQIKDGRLIIYTSKTGQPVSFKLNDKLKSLFKLVNYEPLPYTNEHYNRILKAIGAETETGHLTAHMARHTFGTLCASAGISQEVTAKLMGHSSIRTTAIYYQLTSDRLDLEVQRLYNNPGKVDS